MSLYISLQTVAKSKVMGIRALAVPIRNAAEEALHEGEEVVFDFSGVGATQSFVDELVGAVILREGPSILSKIVFKGCSEDVRTILKYVTADRADQFHKTHAKSASLCRAGSFSPHACIA